MPQIIPIKDLKDTAAISEMCHQADSPIFVTKNGYGRLVVMDINYYEKPIQKMCEAEAILDGDTGNKYGI